MRDRAPLVQRPAPAVTSAASAPAPPVVSARGPAIPPRTVDQAAQLSQLRAVDPLAAMARREAWREGASAGRRAPQSASPEPADGKPFPFPHADRIGQLLGGGVSFSGVLDRAGTAARGTPAFTEGAVTHFASEDPGLHVAAHEATHQLQHAGRTHDAGLGAEGHATVVANAIATGRPAAQWITRRGAPVASAERGYVNPKDQMPRVRVGDTGDTLTYGDQEAYATASLIEQGNKMLQAKGSDVEISAGGGGKDVQTPDGSGGSKSLSRVNVKFKADPTGGTAPEDCRRTAHEVMGGWADKSAPPPQISAVCAPGGAGPEVVQQPEFPADTHALVIYLDKRIKETPEYKDMSEEDKVKFRDKVRKEFDGLSPSEKTALKSTKLSQAEAEALGIDRYAQPGVGEAYAVFPAIAPASGFSFHYGAVIIAAGPDRLVLENFTRSGSQTQRNKDWRIETYGPPNKPDQTFQDQHADAGWHTIRVQTESLFPAYFAELQKKTTLELVELHEASADPWQKYYIKEVLMKRSFMVKVDVIDADDSNGEDEVFVIASNKRGRHKTDRQTIHSGSSFTFSLPLAAFWPMIGSSVSIEVYDHDWLSSNDLTLSMQWDPFKTKTAHQKSTDSEYDAEVKV